jgi:hypothetical protein
MNDWDSQFDEMIANGDYDEALNLLDTSSSVALKEPVRTSQSILIPRHKTNTDSVVLAQSKRRKNILTLHAVALFKRRARDQAIDAFIDLDINPAKVASLYPERISGRLARHSDAQEELFGGRGESVVRAERERKEYELDAQRKEDRLKDTAQQTSGSLGKASPMKKGRKESERDDDTASVKSSKGRRVDDARPAADNVDGEHVHFVAGLLLSFRHLLIHLSLKIEEQDFRRSVNTLIRYLTDRRQKVNKALANISPGLRPSPSQRLPFVSAEELLSLPDEAPSILEADGLSRVAQVVDTVLFKCYLAVLPSMLGPLCRLDNWCEVEEVEELLTAAEVPMLGLGI